jgi:glycosyltransferase involved in cell wall biosynthesis
MSLAEKTTATGRFVIGAPGHNSIYDDESLALHKHNRLRCIAMGTRRGVEGLPAEFTRLLPAFGLLVYATGKTMSQFNAESFRCRMYPWLDHWVKKQMQPGDHVISGYAYLNECFKWARAQGGHSFLDAGNSHPENFWSILTEESRRWNYPRHPVAEHYYHRSLEMMEHVDYVLAASTFVSRSFLSRGFKPERVLHHPRTVNFSMFYPAKNERPKDRPLTLVSTGLLCLRKGSPYLFEAFRLVRKKVPGVRLLVRRSIGTDFKHVLARYSDLPITWLEAMPHAELAEHLRQADIFLLPSLEDGLALTVVEALACGLPAIVTPNTGASDLIQPGVNGEVVPIRDPQAIADAVMKWADRIFVPGWQPRTMFDTKLLSFENFERTFIGQLRELNLV